MTGKWWSEVKGAVKSDTRNKKYSGKYLIA